jgi:hypothetical protein
MRTFFKIGLFLSALLSGSGCLVLMNAGAGTAGSPVLSPEARTVAVGNGFSFSASGGTAPYTYSILSGLGSIHPKTGSFTAGGSAGTTVVQVADAEGATASATVTVNAALAISPATTTAYPGDSKTFSSTGGVEPITYSLNSGSGTLSSSTFNRDWSVGSASVKATDSIGNTSTATVTLSSAYIQTGSTLSESYRAIVRDTSGGYYAVGEVVNGTGSTTTYEGVPLHTGTHVFVTFFTEQGYKGSTVILSSGAGKIDTVGGAAWDDLNKRVIVVGTTNGVMKSPMVGTSDLYVIAIARNLTTQAIAQQGATGRDTGALGVATDANGNIAVVGWSKGAFQAANAGSEDAIISMMTPAGVSLWKKQFGTSLADRASAVAISGTSVYVAGSSACDTITIAQHSTRLPRVPALLAATIGAFLDPLSARAAAGCSGATLAFAAKYGIADGVRSWSPTVEGTSSITITGLALDSSLNLYAVGYTGGKFSGANAPSAGMDSMAIMKFDSSGVQQFAKLTGISGSLTQARALVVASSGEVIAAGLTNGNLGTGASGGLDHFVSSLKPSDGTSLWTLQSGSAGDEISYAITRGPAGTVVAAGGTNGSLPQRTNAGSSDAWLLKLTAAGVPQ